LGFYQPKIEAILSLYKLPDPCEKPKKKLANSLVMSVAKPATGRGSRSSLYSFSLFSFLSSLVENQQH
jgi:hypothetical protein